MPQVFHNETQCDIIMHLPTSVFDRNGHAALSDLQTKEWKDLFAFLEKEQAIFQEKATALLSKDYPWPRDPLYNFSRVWEYPYIFHHILKLKDEGLIGMDARIVDLGSGVTFFPFCISKLGFNVICLDNDPVCERNMQGAIKALALDNAHLCFKLSSDKAIPLTDKSADIIYCISVLEHVNEFEPLIDEMARILVDGGFLLLTIDIDLLPDVKPSAKRFSEFGIKRFYALMSYLQRHFDIYYPEKTIHPSDLLHSGVGPFPLKNIQGMALLWFLMKQMIKPLVGKKPNPVLKKLHLTVDGFVLRKKQPATQEKQ
jgi:SAM-dependent methyltransferase